MDKNVLGHSHPKDENASNGGPINKINPNDLFY